MIVGPERPRVAEALDACAKASASEHGGASRRVLPYKTLPDLSRACAGITDQSAKKSALKFFFSLFLFLLSVQVLDWFRMLSDYGLVRDLSESHPTILGQESENTRLILGLN